MRRFLKSPGFNAICIGLFSAFYALVFFTGLKNIAFESGSQGGEAASFWSAWGGFLAAGHQVYIAYALIAATMLLLILLLMRRQPYDEYHTSILTHCLVAAAVLTLAAIAIFYLMVLTEPVRIVEKFTLFIVIHWTTVVLSNLTYVILCRWR